MKHQKKMTRHERQNLKNEVFNNALVGKGHFVFQNSSGVAELKLPKDPIKGSPGAISPRVVPPNGKFEGDSYFLQMMKTGLVRLMETIVPEKEIKMEEEKLILDQPETVTTEGVVEQVVVNKKNAKTKKNENSTPSGNVLLNENPSGNVVVIEK